MPRSRQRRSSDEKGQAAVEFVFGMLVLLAIVSVLYQALHFELDVFNRLNEVRYNAFRTAHRNQDTTDDEYFGQTVQFTQLSELRWSVPQTILGFSVGTKRVKIKVPFQTGVDSNLKYPNKTFRMRKGTKCFEPYLMRSPFYEIEMAAALLAHHYEDTKDIFKSTIAQGVQVPAPFVSYFSYEDYEDLLNYSF